MAELKLRRLTELNARLREDLERPRIKVSDACQSCVLSVLFMQMRLLTRCDSMINYTRTTKDFMVPSTWGSVSFSSRGPRSVV